MAARVGVVVVAIFVLAWLGVMERDARLQARGVKAAGRLSVPGKFARAETDLRRAGLLNPDPVPDLNRAYLYKGAGQWRRAAALTEDVLHREPENLSAWGILLAITHGHDPAAVARARAAIRRLNPFDARAR